MALTIIDSSEDFNPDDIWTVKFAEKKPQSSCNGKLHYIFLADRSWRCHRVNPPGNFYKVTRHDCCPTGPKFENKRAGFIIFDVRAHPYAMRRIKYIERRESGANRENNMV